MRRRLLPLLALSLLWTACGPLDEGGDAARVVTGLVVAGPDLERPDGTPVEAGVVVADVFYGEVSDPLGIGLGTPVGIPGASVTLGIFGGLDGLLEEVILGDQGDGTYRANSLTAPELVYSAGAEYRVQVEDDQPDPFLVTVDAAPSAEPPRLGVDRHAAGTDLVVERSGLEVAFLSVFDLDGGPAETWTNRPASPAGFLDVVSNPGGFQADTFTIPGSAFPTAGDYAVVLTTVQRGVPSADLYADSGVWIGASAATALTVE